ncbi:MAG: hypothetical protein ABEN55_15340, partial [Bradymonadaceae bacterium]
MALIGVLLTALVGCGGGNNDGGDTGQKDTADDNGYDVCCTPPDSYTYDSGTGDTAESDPDSSDAEDSGPEMDTGRDTIGGDSGVEDTGRDGGS